MSLNTTNEFLTDLLSRRRPIGNGHNPFRFIERVNGRIIEPTAFEPDPSTFRGEFYYNAITNTLYKRVITRKTHGIIVAYWKKVSE